VAEPDTQGISSIAFHAASLTVLHSQIIIPQSLKGNKQSKEDKAKGLPDPRWEEQRIDYIKKHIVGPPTLDLATVQRFAALTLSTDKKIDDGRK
jgi:hypothetical protein